MSWLTQPTSVSPPAGEQQKLVADAFLESYVRWRETCEDVRAAYGRWTTSTASERGGAFEGYRAALEREELAASVHSDCTDRVRALAR